MAEHILPQVFGMSGHVTSDYWAIVTRPSRQLRQRDGANSFLCEFLFSTNDNMLQKAFTNV